MPDTQALTRSGTTRTTTPTMPFEFGDVVLVPFPFTSHVASKNRHAAVVSNRTCNTAKPDVVVMAISSQLHPSPGQGEV